MSQKQTALVTGAAKGIGRATAIRLGADGYKVIAHFRGDREGAEATRQMIEAEGAECLLLQGDLATEQGTDQLAEKLAEMVDGLDVIVNNAAVLHLGYPDEISRAAVEETVAVNVIAVHDVIAKLAPLLRDGARVVNVSSDAARLPRGGLAIYAASKAAVDSLTRSFAEWLGPRGISVNAVAPGPVRTEMLEPMIADEKVKDSFIRSSARGRLAEVGDVVPVIAFLASPESSWINGQTVEATGGRTSW